MIGMGTSFSKSLEGLSCKNIKMVFFPGKHDWASADLLAEGMTTLNGWFFANVRSKASPYSDERDAFAERILKEIGELSESQAGKAAALTELLAGLTLPNALSTAVRAHLSAFRTNPEAKLYAEADAAMDKYVKKYFALKSSSTYFNRADEKATKEGNKLAEKYASTPFAETFRRVAQPSVGN